MNRDELFLRTLDDLESRLQPGRDEYNVLGISALLRKLLLDSEPLVDQVKRDRGVRIAFHVNVTEPFWKQIGEPAPQFWSREDGLDPHTPLPALDVREVSRKGLLAMVVMLYRSQEITVKDVILQGANIGGAVHAGRPKTAKQEALRELERQLAIGSYPAGVRELQAIGRVVLRGLDPLRRVVVAELITAAGVSHVSPAGDHA